MQNKLEKNRNTVVVQYYFNTKTLWLYSTISIPKQNTPSKIAEYCISTNAGGQPKIERYSKLHIINNNNKKEKKKQKEAKWLFQFSIHKIVIELFKPFIIMSRSIYLVVNVYDTDTNNPLVYSIRAWSGLPQKPAPSPH